MSPMTARAALATGAILAGTVTAHTWAGGELPSVGWIGLVSVLVFVATRAVFRGRISARVMVVGLVAAQLGLHVLLTATAAHPTHHLASAHHGTVGSSSLDVLSTSWQMAMAHALSAVLTVVVWSVVVAALDDIVRVPDQPSLAVQGQPGLVSDAAAVVPTVAGWRLGAPRRGPPRALSLLSA